MEPTEVLYLIVEASLALAGFAGVVNALTRRAGSATVDMCWARISSTLVFPEPGGPVRMKKGGGFVWVADMLTLH